MRALFGLFASLFLLAPAFGCGDALDLGQSGHDPGLPACNFQPNAAGTSQCSACTTPGDRCGLTSPNYDRQQVCCCGASSATGASNVWQCLYNSDGCPSSPPKLNSECDLSDATCQYCTDNGAIVFSCANRYWQGGSRSQGC